ncbi:MAG: response regulator, partial [Alphaproteobacteria bacterium]
DYWAIWLGLILLVAGVLIYFNNPPADMDLQIGEAIEAEEYSDAKCLIYTAHRSLQDRLFNFASRWGMNIVTTSDLHNVCRMLVENRDESGLPILLLDGSSIDGELLEFVNYVKFGASDNVEIVLIDTNRAHSNCEGSITAIVTDLSTPRQLFNAIHAASRKYDLPEDVTVLTDSTKEHFKKLNVLIAEDSSVNRTKLEEILRGHDMNVVSAEDGDQALELFEDHTIDIAIVDMQMPNVGGLDVIREYNMGHGLFRKIPFIVLTANVTIDAKNECERAGAAAYMKKPVNETELLQLIYQHTGTHKNEAFEEHDAADKPVKTYVKDIYLEAIDLDVAKNLMTISKRKGFFEELVDNYLHDLKQSIEIIQRAVIEGDFSRYHNEAHAIKGASANIGAREVYEIARITNDDNEQDFQKNANNRCKDLSSALKIAEVSFKELINSYKSNLDGAQ